MAEPHPPEQGGATMPRRGWTSRLLDGRSLLRAAIGWMRSHPRVAIAGGAGLLAAGIGVWAIVALVFPPAADSHASLAAALDLMQSGKIEAARSMAAELRGREQISYADRGAVLFILGSAAAGDAEVHTSVGEQRVLFLVASRYLEEARLCGFPAGKEAEGLALLGESLVHSGRPNEALPILKQALAVNPQRQREIYELLIQAALEAQPPQPKLALDFSRRYLATAGLTPEQRDRGRLQQGEIHLLLGDLPGGRTALSDIRQPSTVYIPAQLLLVRMLLVEVDREAQTRGPDQPLPAEVHDALAAALGALEELDRARQLDSELRAQAQLLAAMCYARLDEQGKAIGLFVRIRRAHVGSPLALAAAIFEADMHLASGRSDEALKIYERAIQSATAAAIEKNPWLPRSALENQLSAAFHHFVERREYARAVDLARVLPPLLDETLSYQWRAQAQHSWAEQLLAQAAGQPLAAGEALRSEARMHFRQAGADYERLAELRIMTRNYLDDLSRSASDYLAGQGYVQAVGVFRRFLKSDPQDGRAEALTGLGEALLAIGQADAALTALDQCGRSFPRHPASYKARYVASLARLEQGNLDEARKLLVDNLYNHSLTPDSAEWRDSLFALGKLRWREGTEGLTRSRSAGGQGAGAAGGNELGELERADGAFQEAIRLLDEAVRRYPRAAQTTEARYLLADSHRQAANWPRQRLDAVAIEASKAPLVRQMQEELDAAVKEFSALIAELGNDRDGRGQSPLSQTILRNSYFGRADTLFDMGRYDEAAEAYSAATNRYQNEPESLSAYVQIAACYRRQDRQSEARGTLEQARLVLARIRKDADFRRTTPYSRDEWNNLLTWLSAL
ncbi:MAG TPA: tetratricopeptide repeat protein [Pirellulaceae bacterium]|nr:tetratricopeptide repeat protein [Pirellulaceae bacterium]